MPMICPRHAQDLTPMVEIVSVPIIVIVIIIIYNIIIIAAVCDYRVSLYGD